jgi:type I restriction enzyme, S subunit
MPNSIQTLSIGEVVEKIIGGGTPSREVEEYYKGNIPWFTVKDLTHHRLSQAQEYITKDAVKNSATNIIPKGNVIVATRMALGKAFINETDAAINQDLKALVPDKKKITAEYLLYSILHKANIIEKMGTGTTVKGIRLDQLKALLVQVPPIKEQTKITSILSTVDKAIEKTEAIIEQTKKVKKGLMQQLLTKGIGHTKFKKTEIGEIPEEWTISTFGSIFKQIKSGISRRFVHEDVGYPVIRSTNIDGNKLKLDDLKYWYTTDTQGVDLKNYILENGDLLVNFINSLSQIGKCCIFEEQNRPYIFTTNIFSIKVDEKRIINKYFYYYSQTDMYKKDIQNITKPAVNQASFTKADFEGLKIALPSIQEQQKIVDILSSIDNKIITEEEKLNKFNTLKKGLMQVLLTGKVRVKVDDEVMSQ